ncbi:hypothetical protein LSH36_484g04103 [Paralvinella palmiformis]|uniref:Centrosomal protein kizuna n=1 Tax=Paralvinella palmiformis TaxID=53620 RepID=A0AAD9JA99_9ANNE|nr:hypothetical protein LSH36_484g04103 [Paralvinella palmiformis]
MSVTNVAFYQKIKDLQDRQHEKEKQRLELEQQFNSYIKSDHRLARLKAIRLENYWKKICEDEKRSQLRNEKLLQEFERVDSHMATLSARTERLRAMKKQYEDCVEKAYPNWKEKILHHLQQEKYVARQTQLESNFQAQQTAAAASVTHLTSQTAIPPAGNFMREPAVISQPLAGTSGAVPTTFQASTTATNAGYVNIPDQPTAYHKQRGEKSQNVATASGQARVSGTDPAISQKTDMYNKERDADDEQSSQGEGQQPVKRPSHTSREAQQKSSTHQVAPQAAKEWRTDDTDDFDSEMSLPLSGYESKSKPVISTSQSRPVKSQTNESITLSPEITLEGLYNLLAAIERELPTSTMLSEIYQTELPVESVRQEIMANANKGSLLSHMNCGSISMVVIDQLPLLVSSCEDGCLLPDNIICQPSPIATQDSVRLSVHLTSRAFWDHLCEHFVCLLRHNAMNPGKIAEIFAPLLISDDSPYSNGATALLNTVLQNADVDVVSPTSTSTFSTLSPRKQQKYGVSKLSSQMPSVDLKYERDDDNNEDDFFSQPLPKDETAVPLTQTAAYRKFLGGTISTTENSVSYVDSEEDDDDVEAQLQSGKQDDSVKKDGIASTRSDKVVTPPVDQTATMSQKDVSRVSSPSLASTGGMTADIEHKSITASFGSTGKSTKKTLVLRGDSDTDEEISIPGVNMSEVKSTSKPAEEEDDFDFYG